MCLFSFFSPVCPSPDLELNEPTSSTLLQGQYPLALWFSFPPTLSPKASLLLPHPALPVCGVAKRVSGEAKEITRAGGTPREAILSLLKPYPHFPRRARRWERNTINLSKLRDLCARQR